MTLPKYKICIYICIYQILNFPQKNPDCCFTAPNDIKIGNGDLPCYKTMKFKYGFVVCNLLTSKFYIKIH